MSDFTDKQMRFIAEYLQCLNATEAARRAGYSENTAHVIGHENLRKPKIRAEIDRVMHQSAMQPDEILFRLTQQARSDMGDLLRPGESLGWLDMQRARELGVTHLIKKFRRDKDGGISVELYDAQSALVHLAKIHALFADRIIVEDWRSKLIDDIKSGAVYLEDVARAFGGMNELVEAINDRSLAAQLFAAAGVPAQDTQG